MAVLFSQTPCASYSEGPFVCHLQTPSHQKDYALNGAVSGHVTSNNVTSNIAAGSTGARKFELQPAYLGQVSGSGPEMRSGQ